MSLSKGEKLGPYEIADPELAVSPDGQWVAFDVDPTFSPDGRFLPDGKHVAMFPSAEIEAGGGNLHATFLLNFFDEVRRGVLSAK